MQTSTSIVSYIPCLWESFYYRTPAPSSLKATVETMRSYRDLLHLFQACVHTTTPIEGSPSHICYAALQKKLSLMRTYMETCLKRNTIQKIYENVNCSHERIANRIVDTAIDVVDILESSTLLHHISISEEDLALAYLSQGSDTSTLFFSRTTALEMAIKRGLSMVVKTLCQEPCFFAQNAHGCTMLHLATHPSDIKTLRMLLSQLCYQEKNSEKRYKILHIVNSKGYTALVEAIHRGAVKHVELLLNAGSGVDYIPHTKHPTNWPPIAHAVFSAPTTHSSVCLDALIRHKANVNISIGPSATPLTLACHTGNFFSVQRLVTAGADIVLKDCDEGQQPISIARREGHPEIADWLEKEVKLKHQVSYKRRKTH